MAAVEAGERGGGIPGRWSAHRAFAPLPRPQPGGRGHRQRMLGAPLSAAGVDRILRRDAAARRATPADGGAGRPRRAARTSVPALADRLDVGCRRSGLVLDQEHLPLPSPLTSYIY